MLNFLGVAWRKRLGKLGIISETWKIADKEYCIIVSNGCYTLADVGMYVEARLCGMEFVVHKINLSTTQRRE